MGSNPILSVGRFAAEFYIEIKSANCRSTQAAEGAPLEREMCIRDSLLRGGQAGEGSESEAAVADPLQSFPDEA